jgi:hypothetical protein
MNLSEKLMREALKSLSSKINKPVQLIIGGGGAMILAHHLALATTDIDGIPKGIELGDLDQLVKEVSQELNIPKDWLNPYFSTFTHVLPSDYGSRLVSVCQYPNLEVLALSKEDLLIMKCFAGRQKDVVHMKALLKQGPKLAVVEAQLEQLIRNRIPGAQDALDFLDDVRDQMEGG